MSECLCCYNLDEKTNCINKTSYELIYHEICSALPPGFYLHKNNEYLYIGDDRALLELNKALSNAISSMELEGYSYSTNNIDILLKYSLNHLAKMEN